MKSFTMKKQNQIVSFSGGKDSTAMAILHPEIPLAHFNTGWEFPEMIVEYPHYSLVLPLVYTYTPCFMACQGLFAP